MIHKTAIIDPKAKISDNVKIGQTFITCDDFNLDFWIVVSFRDLWNFEYGVGFYSQNHRRQHSSNFNGYRKLVPDK